MQFGLASITATFTNKNNSDPTTGQITITVTECSPYEYTIKGMTSNIIIHGTLGPLPPFTRVHYSLPADMYVIEALSSEECRSILKGEIKNCNSISASLQIPFVCNGQKATVTAIPSGGIAPYDFKWYKNNLRIDVPPFGPEQKLLAGFYYIVITDALGCEFRKDFEVKSHTLNYDIEKQEFYCFTQNRITIKIKNANNRRFNYSWSDGTNYNESDMHVHYVNSSVNNTVTVTDLLTNCTSIKTYFSTFNSYFGYFEYPIFHSIKHDVNNNNKGEVVILLKDGKLIGNKFSINVFKNGNKYGPTLGLFDRLAKISNLGVGDYCFDIIDAKGCKINQLCQKIESCGELGLPVKMTVDFQLPSWEADAYIKANVINSGGQCTYSWFVNDYYRIYTTGNIILGPDISKIQYGEEEICVVAHCPCGESSKICVKHNPCDNSQSKKKVKYINKSIPSFCYKTLPGGKEIIYSSKSELIKLDIDLTQKFNANSQQGLPLYNYRLKDVYWEDRYVLTKSVNGNILHIERLIDEEITTSKTYKLILIDGNGCIAIENYEVKNTIEVENIGDCAYNVKCNDEIVEQVYNKRIEKIGSECMFKIYCGDNEIETVPGTIFKGEFAEQDIQQPGKCFYYEYCIYRVVNQTINNIIYKPQPDLIKKSDLNYAFVYKKRIAPSIPCCTPPVPDPFNNNPPKETVGANLINLNLLEQNYDDLISDDADNPCVIAYVCPNGNYIKILGTKINTTICTRNGFCYEVSVCRYENVGGPGGYTFDSDEAFPNGTLKFPLIKNYARKLVPCPQGELFPCTAFANPILRTSKNESCKVYSNPFDKELVVHCQILENKLPIKIELYNIVGRKIYTSLLVSSTKDVKLNIPTGHLSSGVYFMKINIGLDFYIEKLIKQN